jgi:hypothetical protein
MDRGADEMEHCLDSLRRRTSNLIRGKPHAHMECFFAGPRPKANERMCKSAYSRSHFMHLYEKYT